MKGNGMGMDYEDVRKRMKRIATNDKADPGKRANLIQSLGNQAKLRDGDGAVRELHKELHYELADRKKKIWI
jgi:hypothetical protein